jgi:hypothetical protein
LGERPRKPCSNSSFLIEIHTIFCRSFQKKGLADAMLDDAESSWGIPSWEEDHGGVCHRYAMPTVLSFFVEQMYMIIFFA